MTAKVSKLTPVQDLGIKAPNTPANKTNIKLEKAKVEEASLDIKVTPNKQKNLNSTLKKVKFS